MWLVNYAIYEIISIESSSIAPYWLKINIDDSSNNKENTLESWLASTSTAFKPSESITNIGIGLLFMSYP